MPELQPNATDQTTGKRGWVGWGTVLLAMLFSIPWILVAVPGLNVTGNSNVGGFSSNRWQGGETLRLFGWPYVHASRLSVADRVYNSMGQIAGKNPTGPSEERLEACLENLTWWTEVYLVDEVTERPKLMPAQLIHNSGGVIDSGFDWSAVDRWNYSTDERSLIQWHPEALLINGALFLCFLLVIVLLLETLARRRKRWWQFSLVDFLVAVSVIGIVGAIVISEVRTGKQQLELADQLKNEFEFEAGLSYRPPIFLTRLIGQSHDRWFEYVGADGAFNRIESLKVDCAVAGDETRDFDLIKKILSRPELDHVTRLNLKLMDQKHFDLVDLFPPENVKSLKLRYFWSVSQTAPSLRNLERVPSLVDLELENPADSFSQLPELPNLVSLTIDSAGKSNGNLEPVADWLSSMSSLRSIWLRVDGQPEPLLPAIPDTVEFMYLAPRRTKEIDLRGLSRLNRLKRISMYTAETQTITQAPQLPELKHFFLQGFAVSDEAPKQWRDHASPY